MPRISRGKMKAETLTNGLIASARTVRVREGLPPKKIKRQEWQNTVWDFYDLIEVYHYACQWVGNTLSRAKLVVFEDGKLTTNPAVIAIMEAFFGGPDQHGEFLRQAGIHMTVAGEGFLVGFENDEGDEEWLVAAATEMKDSAEGYKLDGDILPDKSLVIRFWRPHPRKPNSSDSPSRPLIPILSQLNEATKYVSAQLDSRLTGAGVLLLPQEVTFPTPVTGPDGEQSQEAGLGTLIQEFADTASAAKANPESPAARIPSFLQVPGEHVGNIKHITFWTPLDEQAPALRTELIRRLALGMDMPADALAPDPEGGSNNHWSAWQVEDSLIKSHAEPLLELITRALTTEYLRDLLMDDTEGPGMSEEEAKRFTVEADSSEMRLRPDRSQQALEMWDRGELNAAALRREVGFEESDAMGEDEQKLWILRKLAQGSASPQLVEAATRMLGIDLPEIDENEEGREDAPLPRSLEEHPSNDPPERPANDEARAAALMAISEFAMMRALERAGNRVMSSKTDLAGIPKGLPSVDRYRYVMLNPEQMNFVLEDAWSTLDRVTMPEGTEVERLSSLLDNYARMLITSRQPYDRLLLAKYLDLAKGT